MINLFKKWIEGFFVLLDENEAVISQLQAFISSIVLPRYTAWGQMILGMIAEKVRGHRWRVESYASSDVDVRWIQQQEKAEQAHMKRCLKVPLNVMVDYIIRKNRLQQRKSNSGHKTIPGGLAVVWLSEGFELEEPDAVYALRIAVDIGHLTRDEQYPIEQMFKGNLHIAHSEAPKPQLSEKQKSELNLDYMEVPALEIARQLTLIEQGSLRAPTATRSCVVAQQTIISLARRPAVRADTIERPRECRFGRQDTSAREPDRLDQPSALCCAQSTNRVRRTFGADARGCACS